ARLSPVAFQVTAGPTRSVIQVGDEDPAAEVRALRDRITAHGLSRQDVARAAGVDRRSLSGWAKGDIRPGAERLEVLRTLSALANAIDAERPGRARELLLARRGRVALIDQV